MSSLRALIVDDDDNSRRALAALAKAEGFDSRQAGSLEEARARITAERPDVVLVDLVLPDGSGFDLIQELIAQTERIDFVVVSGFASVDTVVEALRQGATDFITKPVDVARLKTVLANLARTQDLRQRVDELRGQLRELGRFGPLVGGSPPMQTVYDLVSRVAPTQATVLITGESGTGKELVAETVHRLSRRAGKPFVVVNCGAIAPNLIESELFGHERGSFTGAERTHRGLFERAQGGTLFLDEIGEMPLELQVKLLRALETGQITRVGGDKPLQVDVRVVAATHRDLESAVVAGEFRGDLLYRLRVFPIPLPPLNKRGDDLSILALQFLSDLNRQEGTNKTFTPKALQALNRHSWPGNVRELRNAVHRAYIVAEQEIDVDCLALGPDPAAGARQEDGALSIVPGTSLAEMEKRLILASLDHFNGDKRKTADALGVSLKTLYNRLNQYSPS